MATPDFFFIRPRYVIRLAGLKVQMGVEAATAIIITISIRSVYLSFGARFCTYASILAKAFLLVFRLRTSTQP